MAPKGGGKGGGGGGGRGGGVSSCSNCLRRLQFDGDNWENGVVTAFFAVDVIVAFVLLCCLILQTRFKWVKDLSVDKLRNTGYSTAAACLLMTYILYIVDLALREEDTEVVYLYYIMYVFTNGFWRVSDLLILGIIYRTIAESSMANLARKLSGLHKLIVIILGLLSIAAYGMYIAQIVDTIRGRYSYNQTAYRGYQYTSIAYYSLYLVAALLAGLESFLVMFRARSKATLLMLSFVTPALILHNLFLLVNIGLITYNSQSSRTTGKATYSVGWACNYIAEITNIFIYGGVVFIGWITFRKGASKSGKYVGGTANGEYVSETSYAPVHNTWGR